jgi:hypothetical protein
MNFFGQKEIFFIKGLCCAFWFGICFSVYSMEGTKEKVTLNTVDVPLKTQIELLKLRGRNSFKLIESSINKDVCSNILASLNKPREHDFFKNKESLRKGEKGIINLDLPEMMIQTELNLPRVDMSEKSAGPMRVEEFVVDFDKNGVDESVYRTTGYLSGVWVHSLSVLPVSYDSEKYLHVDAFWKEQQALGNISKFLWQWKEFDGLKAGDFLRTFGLQVIYELIEFNDHYYILATRSVIKDNSSIKVAVMQIANVGDIYPACLFETKFIVK